jgi:hypothetical protein
VSIGAGANRKIGSSRLSSAPHIRWRTTPSGTCARMPDAVPGSSVTCIRMSFGTASRRTAGPRRGSADHTSAARACRYSDYSSLSARVYATYSGGRQPLRCAHHPAHRSVRGQCPAEVKEHRSEVADIFRQHEQEFLPRLAVCIIRPPVADAPRHRRVSNPGARRSSSCMRSVPP